MERDYLLQSIFSCGSKCGFTLTSFKIADGSEFKVDIGVSKNCKGTKCPAVTKILWSNREYILDLDGKLYIFK